MKRSLTFLIELRRRLLRVLAIWALIAAVCAFFSNDIYTLLALPILHQLTGHQHLIAVAVTTPFFVPLQSAIVMSIYICVPFLLFELWRFIVPALYHKERRLLWMLLTLGTLLFYSGTLFAYSVVLPLVFGFLTHFVPAGVSFMPDISAYFDFVTRLFLAFGAAFEVPIVIVLLVYCNVLSCDKIASSRPYVIVGCFVVGMLLTPPDVISQLCLALPLCFLFEAGLWLAKWASSTSAKVIED